MRRRILSAWVRFVCLVLTLLLSECAPRVTTQSPAPTPAPAAPPTRPATPRSPLRVGTTPNYPPIVFKEQGHLTGLEIDFAQALGEELGRSIDLVELPWEALIPALEAGQIDVIMAGMSITEARQQRVRFVEPYLQVGQMAIIRKADRLELGSTALLSLTRRRVGFVAGTTGAAYVQEQLPLAEHVPVDSTAEGLQALRTGKIDVFIHDAVTAWRVGSDKSDDMLMVSYDPLTKEYLAWAVRLTDDALYRDLETVLARWKRSGRLQTMFQKWLKFHPGQGA